MKIPALLTGIALLAVAPALGAQETAEKVPTQTPPGAEQTLPPTDPPTPPAPDAPTMSAEPEPDPNADVPPVPVSNDPAMVPAPADVPRDQAAPPGSTANPIIEGGNMTPPPQPKDHYPLCGGEVQDSCMQPGEAPRGYGKAGS